MPSPDREHHQGLFASGHQSIAAYDTHIAPAAAQKTQTRAERVTVGARVAAVPESIRDAPAAAAFTVTSALSSVDIRPSVIALDRAQSQVPAPVHGSQRAKLPGQPTGAAAAAEPGARDSIE